MARKPIHLQAFGKLQPRDRIWAAIRVMGRFRRDELCRRGKVEEGTLDTYLRGLVAAGYVRRVREGLHAGSYYVNHDVGVIAPRVTRDGKPVTQGDRREAMWRTMKIVKNFTATELAMKASVEGKVVDVADAKCYVGFLAKAGYLIAIAAGKPGSQARWRFVDAKNAGPRAPQIQRVKHVYDPNLGVVVWHPEANA